MTEAWFEEAYDDTVSAWIGTGSCGNLTELNRGDLVEQRVRAVDASGKIVRRRRG